MLLVSLILTACSCKDFCEPVYIDRDVIVKVPVKCKVPVTTCDFKRNTDTEIVSSLLECIIDLKESIKVCQ